jgi:hypothetical protein
MGACSASKGRPGSLQAQLFIKLVFFLLGTVNEAAQFANQHLLALGARDPHVGLVQCQEFLLLAGMDGPPAILADQRLLAETAFHGWALSYF